MVRFIWGGDGDLTRDKADSFRAKIGESDVDIVLHTQNNGIYLVMLCQIPATVFFTTSTSSLTAVTSDCREETTEFKSVRMEWMSLVQFS